MPKLPQIVSSITPGRYNPPLMPAGGLLQPVAEGLGAAGSMLQKVADQQVEVLKSEQQISNYNTAEQRLLDIQEQLKAEPDLEKHQAIYKDKANQIKQEIFGQKLYPDVRASLTLGIGRLIAQQDINIRNNVIRQRTEQSLSNLPEILDGIVKSATISEDVVDQAGKIIGGLNHIESLEKSGTITPIKAEEIRQKFLQDVDYAHFENIYRKDPASLLKMTDKELLALLPYLDATRFHDVLKIKEGVINNQDKLIKKEEENQKLLNKENAILYHQEQARIGDINRPAIFGLKAKWGYSDEEIRLLIGTYDKRTRDFKKRLDDTIAKEMIEEELGIQFDTKNLEKLMPGYQDKKVKNFRARFEATDELTDRAYNGEDPEMIWGEIANRKLKELQVNKNILPLPTEVETQLVEGLLDGSISDKDFMERAGELEKIYPEFSKEKPKK